MPRLSGRNEVGMFMGQGESWHGLGGISKRVSLEKLREVKVMVTSQV